MTQDFISTQDRIINAAIDIISDAGLASLNVRNLSFRTNLSEDMLYKYYLDTDEILVDIVKTYFRFDKGIFRTLRARDISYAQKIDMYIDAFGDYYNNYYSLSAIMLHYEELLHNVNTRELVQSGYLNRRSFLIEQFEGAIKKGEFPSVFTGQHLADELLGLFLACSLIRRMENSRRSFKDDIKEHYTAWCDACKNF